jgi:ribonuclease J
MEMKTEVKDALGKFLFKQTKRKPMVLPIIMSI